MTERARHRISAATQPPGARAQPSSRAERSATRGEASPATTRSRQRFCARLSTITARLGTDEIAVLTLIAERLLRGRERYGALHLATDGRDWPAEALAELLDFSCYASMALLQRDKTKGNEKGTP
jgi:hypothetical protein